jgi:hypothetical protein
MMNLQQKYKQSFGKGWFLHSWQHALAARGIKTKYDKANSRYLARKEFIRVMDDSVPVTSIHGESPEQILSNMKRLFEEGKDELAKRKFARTRFKAIDSSYSNEEFKNLIEQNPDEILAKMKYQDEIDRKRRIKLFQAKKFSEMSDEEQLKEVESGNKAVVMSGHSLKTNLPMLTVEHDIPPLYHDFLYFQPEKEHVARELKNIYESIPTKEIKHNPVFHKKIGKLLDYSDEEIEEFIKKDNKYDAKKPTSTWSEPSIGPQLVGRRKQYDPLPTVSREFLDDVSWLKDQGASYKDLKHVYPDKKPAVKAAWMKIEGVDKQ